MADYFILDAMRSADHCAIWDFPEDLAEFHRPAEGKEMGKDYPKPVKFRMTSEVPGIQIADYIRNTLGYAMASARLKEIFAGNATGKIEYLPFTLLNHKGRVAADDCFIINPIGIVDCADPSGTEGDEDPVHPGRYDYLERLVLDPKKLDEKRNLFRCLAFPQALIARDDLCEVLEKADLTGLEMLAVGEEVELS